MSLASALNNAFTGLKANTRAANLVSTNVANATTESYGRRTLALSSATGGVRVDGVVRNVDPVLVADRWVSDADTGFGSDIFSFATSLETQVGDGAEPGSLVGRVVAFENALLNASVNPAARQRLETVAETADRLAQTLNSLSAEVQDTRARADAAIDRQVATLNKTMGQIEKINDAIKKAMVTRTDVSSLMDERQRLVDSVSEIVPLRVVERDRGEIALFSRGGATLLDGSASVIGFTPTQLITPDMTLGGPLSGLTLNGAAVDSGVDGMFGGGTLAAQFDIRDNRAPARQAELDGIARELMQRLDNNTADPTIALGDAGLFRDSTGPINGGTGNYAAFDPANEVGIAGRIMLHAEQVRPGDGSSWRLRDGIYATAQGEVGDATVLQGIDTALSAVVPPQSAVFGTVVKDFVSLVSDFSSSVASDRVRAEGEQTFLATRNTALRELELARGVDTDQELQRLIQIEQHYAANAEVMSTVDNLIERLLNI